MGGCSLSPSRFVPIALAPAAHRACILAHPGCACRSVRLSGTADSSNPRLNGPSSSWEATPSVSSLTSQPTSRCVPPPSPPQTHRPSQLLPPLTHKHRAGRPHGYILQSKKSPSLSSLIALVRTTRQAQKLVAHHEAEPRDVALPSSFPNYPKHAVSIFLRAVGLAHYHNGMVWPWFSFFFSAAMQHRGLGPSQDHAVLEKLIVRDGAILEVRPTRSRARMLRPLSPT